MDLSLFGSQRRASVDVCKAAYVAITLTYFHSNLSNQDTPELKVDLADLHGKNRVNEFYFRTQNLSNQLQKYTFPRALTTDGVAVPRELESPEDFLKS